MNLRQHLTRLEDRPDIDTVPARTVNAFPIGIDGELCVPHDDEVDSEFEFAVGPVAGYLDVALRRELEKRYGESVPNRDLNLIVAGAQLVTRMMHEWVRTDDIPDRQ